MQKKVLIAVGDKSYSELLKLNFEDHPQDFLISSHEVLHRRYLTEILNIEKPDILIIHDHYLNSDFHEKEEQDKELITLIRNIRIQYEDSLRVVLLCERPKGDLLLSTLVSIGVMDIFNTNSVDLIKFIEQLKDKPRFSRVEKFLVASTPILQGLEELEEEEFEQEKPDEKPIIKKVIEKKVVQKVVNKNIVKRDYKIHIHNHTEKIVGVPVKKKLIMIGSPVARSGSTFVSHLLARTLTQMGIGSTYIESPFSKSYTYDRFIGHKHTNYYRSKFYQYSKYVDTKQISVYEWTKSDVEVVCKHPKNEPIYKEEDITFETLIKVLFSTQSTITIIDVGTDWQYEIFQDAFDIADYVYFVIEPDIPLFQYLEESNDESVTFFYKLLDHEKSALIGNRFDKAILKGSLIKDLYGDKIKTLFPAFSAADIYQAQYDGVFLNDYKEYSKRLEPYITPLLEEILPTEFLKKHRKGIGFMKGLFNKKITFEKTTLKGEETSL
ncbi:hypothetical protein C0966_17165 (plasmid) [Bacillus methanolicus]|uniref:hypothetical protein n=1 Tax=Bacillus methanolicus TaxID=1471 RepID=UPI0023800CAF|nr:hypothetical protein [Bacillus methanolicus]MDE3840996.1 hypothetical protein [Bacillus methanolicus]